MTTLTEHIKTKEQARELAIEWQSKFESYEYGLGELAECQSIFEELGERFDLTEEFKENGII
jgi:hypothetical protein